MIKVPLTKPDPPEGVSDEWEAYILCNERLGMPPLELVTDLSGGRFYPSDYFDGFKRTATVGSHATRTSIQVTYDSDKFYD